MLCILRVDDISLDEDILFDMNDISLDEHSLFDMTENKR